MQHAEVIKTELGSVAATILAWDRSGGSIKIFLDTGVSLSLFFFCFFLLTRRSAAYKKEKEKNEPKSSLGWTERKWLRRRSDLRETRAVDTSQLQLASRRYNPKNTRNQFSEMSVTPFDFSGEVPSPRLGPCATRESQSLFCSFYDFEILFARVATDAYRIIYAAGPESCNRVYFNLVRHYRTSPSILIT